MEEGNGCDHGWRSLSPEDTPPSVGPELRSIFLNGRYAKGPQGTVLVGLYLVSKNEKKKEKKEKEKKEKNKKKGGKKGIESKIR